MEPIPDAPDWRRIRVSSRLRERLIALREAWTGVGRRRLSVHNVIEILAQLAPGKFSNEEIAGVELETKPPGRPKKRPIWLDG